MPRCYLEQTIHQKNGDGQGKTFQVACVAAFVVGSPAIITMVTCPEILILKDSQHPC